MRTSIGRQGLTFMDEREEYELFVGEWGSAYGPKQPVARAFTLYLTDVMRQAADQLEGWCWRRWPDEDELRTQLYLSLSRVMSLASRELPIEYAALPDWLRPYADPVDLEPEGV
jgi:hypothetical protein